MKNWLQRKFVRFLVRGLFNTIDESDVLRIDSKGVIMYQNKPLTREIADKIKTEAGTFNDSLVWEFLTNDMKYVSNQRMWEKSENIEDVLAGKIMLYTIEVMRKKLENLSKM